MKSSHRLSAIGYQPSLDSALRTPHPAFLPTHSPIYPFTRRGGFTLIEVLIASALLSIILGAVYSTFFISYKAVSGLDESMLKLQEGRSTLSMIKREIDSAFYRDGDKKMIFKLEDRDIFGKHTSRIIFTTLSPLRNGVSEMKYYVKESDDRLILYKEISSLFGRKNEPIETDIIEGIGEFLIEVKYNDKWVRTWDSSITHRLPDDIRISLKIKVKDKDVLLFERARPKII